MLGVSLESGRNIRGQGIVMTNHTRTMGGLLLQQRIRRRQRRLLLSPAIVFAVKLGVVTIFMLAYLLAFVWTRQSVIRLGYEISAANDALRDIRYENRRLRTEVLSLKSPARLTRKAQELGLSEPSPDRIVVLK